MSTGLQNVVVVGGSVGGYRTAGALRRSGYEGRLRVVSAEPAEVLPPARRPGPGGLVRGVGDGPGRA